MIVYDSSQLGSTQKSKYCTDFRSYRPWLSPGSKGLRAHLSWNACLIVTYCNRLLDALQQCQS